MTMAFFQSGLILLTASHPDFGVTAVNKVLHTWQWPRMAEASWDLGKFCPSQAQVMWGSGSMKKMCYLSITWPRPLLGWINRKSSGTALLGSREQLLGFTGYFLYLKIWVFEASAGISSSWSTSGLFFLLSLSLSYPYVTFFLPSPQKHLQQSLGKDNGQMCTSWKFLINNSPVSSLSTHYAGQWGLERRNQSGENGAGFDQSIQDAVMVFSKNKKH